MRLQALLTAAAPYQEVLDAISRGAAELVGEPMAAVRMIDGDDPDRVRIVAATGLTEEEAAVSRTGIGEGAGGRAIIEDALVVVDDYRSAPGTIAHFARKGLAAAMAAPLHDGAEVIGSVVVASYTPGRRYSAAERDVLQAYVAHAGSVLAQARAIERRERMAELRGEWRYRLILDLCTDGISIIGPDDRIVLVNEQLARMAGVPAAELVGRHAVELQRPEDVRELRAALRRVRRGMRERFERTFRRADGTPVHVRVAANPLRNPDGSYAGAVAVLTDLTAAREAQAEVVRMRERLRRSQGLERLGQLASQVAHDFNNMLGVILNSARLSLDAVEADHPAAVGLQRIRDAAEHGGALTSQLLTYGRAGAGAADAQLVSLRDLIGPAVELAGSAAPPGVRLRTTFCDEDPRVRIDPTHLRQVVLNLVDNAFDATGPGGTVEVATRVRRVAPGGARRPGAYASLSVRDDGAGMEPDVARRALEPLFTTKRPGEGTGLGLAIVARIAEQAGGYVELRSAPGRGTTVELLMPCESVHGAELLRGDPVPILLIEDDRAARELTRDMLVREGFAVLGAADTAEALAVDAASDGAFELILTDGMSRSGSPVELLERLPSFRRGAPAIVISGAPPPPPVRRAGAGRATGPVTFLQKPFGAERLIAAVTSALANPRP